MASQPQLVILFAAERSGTHLFRSILASNRAAYAPGEVANAAVPVTEDQETNFFVFRQKFVERTGGIFVPSIQNMEAFLDQYFDRLVEEARSRHRNICVCDIKYAHIVNFVGGWWDMLSPPLLLSWARTRKVPIIHLVRRSIAETCLSNIYAQQTGVWRTKNPNEISTLHLAISRQRLEREMNSLRRVIYSIREWIEPCQSIEIYYEELLDCESQSWADVRNLLGAPIEKIVSDFVKTTPPYEEVLTNFEELRDLFDVAIAKAPRKSS